MIDFKSEDTGQLALFEREKVDDEENLFDSAVKLSSQGNNGRVMQTAKHLDCIQSDAKKPVLRVNLRGRNRIVASTRREWNFQAGHIVPVVERFGVKPGVVLDNIRVKRFLVEEEYLVEANNKLSSHGTNAEEVNKRQDTGLCTWNGLLLQTKKPLSQIISSLETNVDKICKVAEILANSGYPSASDILLKGIDSDSVFSIACSEEDFLKMEQLKTACPDCLPPVNMIWKCKDKPMRDPIEMVLFRRGDDNMEDYDDDDLSDGPEEGDDNWNSSNDSAFSRGGEYDLSKEWERLVGYPIVFSRMRESSEVTLYFLRTGEVQDLSFEDIVGGTLLASTRTGWLLFLKEDGRSFLYFHACIDLEYNLEPLRTSVTEDGSLIGNWKADIYEEPGKRNHRVILVAQRQSEGGKQLTILTNGGRGWVERTCSVPDQDSPMTAGPVLCTYQKNEDKLKYGLIWLQGSNQVITCHYDTMDMFECRLDGDLDSEIGIALTSSYTGNTLFLYQQSGGVGEPNVNAIQIDDIFVKNLLVHDPYVLTLPFQLFMVQNRRGWVYLKHPGAEDEGGMGKFELYFVSRCGNHVSAFIRRENNAEWINIGTCEGCEHELALFLQATSAIQEGTDATGENVREDKDQQNPEIH